MDGTHRRPTGGLCCGRGGLNAGALQQLDRLHQVVDRGAADDEVAGKAMRLDMRLEAVFHVAGWECILGHGGTSSRRVMGSLGLAVLMAS